MHWRFYTVNIKLKDGKTDSVVWPKLVNSENDPCPLNTEDVYAFYKNNGPYIYSMLSEVTISKTYTTNTNINF